MPDAIHQLFRESGGLLRVSDTKPQKVSPEFYGLSSEKFAYINVQVIDGHTHLTAITKNGGRVSISLAKRQGQEYVEAVEILSDERDVGIEVSETLHVAQDSINYGDKNTLKAALSGMTVAEYVRMKRHLSKIAYAMMLLATLLGALVIEYVSDVVRVFEYTGRTNSIDLYLAISSALIFLWIMRYSYRSVRRLAEI